VQTGRDQPLLNLLQLLVQLKNAPVAFT
jgi:hypothetical protein